MLEMRENWAHRKAVFDADPSTTSDVAKSTKEWSPTKTGARETRRSGEKAIPKADSSMRGHWRARIDSRRKRVFLTDPRPGMTRSTPDCLCCKKRRG